MSRAEKLLQRRLRFVIILGFLSNSPIYQRWTAEAAPGHSTYIISRPGDGTSILGGTFLEDRWDTAVDYDVAKDIFARCEKLAPALNSPDTRIISHNVGLRPARRGGPRVEPEWVDLPLKGYLVPNKNKSSKERKLLVIHAYGIGYVQCSSLSFLT